MLSTYTRGFAAQGVFCHSAIQSAQQPGTNGSRTTVKITYKIRQFHVFNRMVNLSGSYLLLCVVVNNIFWPSNVHFTCVGQNGHDATSYTVAMRFLSTCFYIICIPTASVLLIWLVGEISMPKCRVSCHKLP